MDEAALELSITSKRNGLVWTYILSADTLVVKYANPRQVRGSVEATYDLLYGERGPLTLSGDFHPPGEYLPLRLGLEGDEPGLSGLGPGYPDLRDEIVRRQTGADIGVIKMLAEEHPGLSFEGLCALSRAVAEASNNRRDPPTCKNPDQ